MQLFQIKAVESGDGCYRFVAHIDPSHNIFNGHFPENPVVPGVCTMSMIKECCSNILSREVRYDYVKEVKFLKAILPSLHDELMVNIELKGGDGEITISAKVECADEVMMKLKATII